MAVDSRERPRTQALCWLLDELFVAEADLLALLARGAIGGWRRERLAEFCQLWWGRGCGGSEPRQPPQPFMGGLPYRGSRTPMAKASAEPTGP